MSGSRTCDNCGQPYYRRNVAEAWTSQNPGHRAGWTKSSVKYCTNCQPAAQATRALMLVEARVVPGRAKRPAKKSA